MSIRDLEEEIIEIEKIRDHYRPGSLEWNNIDTIIAGKKKQLSRLKEGSEEEDLLGSCDHDTCNGGR